MSPTFILTFSFMNSSDSSELSQIIEATEADEQIRKRLYAAVEDLARPAGMPSASAAEVLKIQLDEGGDVVKASSRKIGNLRFRLSELLWHGGTSAAGAVVGHQHGIALALAALNFLKRAFDLSAMEVSKEDAELLLRIKELHASGCVPTEEMLKGTPEDFKIATTLQRLAKLGCITVLAGEVRLHESIIIRSGAI